MTENRTSQAIENILSRKRGKTYACPSGLELGAIAEKYRRMEEALQNDVPFHFQPCTCSMCEALAYDPLKDAA